MTRYVGKAIAVATMIGFVVSMTPAFSYAFQTDDRTELTDQVDKLFEPWNNDDTPGAAVGIFQNGKIVYARGYGMANLEHDVPITPQTVFRIGSTSKQFTAMCIAILAEQGKLSLDDDVRKHIPEMQKLDTPFTVRQLVHHQSGVRDYISLMSLVVQGERYSSRDALAMLARQKGLLFPPGDRYSYSNSGYFLLAEIVSRASGMSTSEFAKQHIFDPLEMNSTHFHDDLDLIVKNRASGYSRTRGGDFRINMTQLDIIGDGSIYTTIEDFFKWDQNLYNNALGKGTEELTDTVLTTGKLANGRMTDYAFGLSVSTSKGLRKISHGGSWVGFRSYYARYPDQKFSVVVFTNNALGPAGIVQKITDLYLADHYEKEPPRQVASQGEGRRPRRQQADPSTRPEPVKYSSDQLQEYTAAYYNDELDAYATLSITEDELTVKLGNTSGRLTAGTADNFRWRGRRIEFVRDASKRITGFTLRASSATQFHFTRIGRLPTKQR